MTPRGGPLQGVRVVEITKVWAGPYVGRQLAMLGAEVIRVESRGALDVTRTFGVDDIDQAPGFQAVNPQKLSVQIDMKTPDGLDLLKRLIGEADIVVENLRPGAIDRSGVGYQAMRQVRPDIIYVSMGMWGNDGPLAYQTGYAPCFVALGGVSALVGRAGEAPAGMNVRYSDSTFGTAAAYAALVALVHRRRTGEGQYVDVSAVETVSSMIGDIILDYTLNGRVARAEGNRHPDMAPHGVFPAAGGEWLAIAVSSDGAWRGLAGAIGIGDDSRFATLADRKANEDALEALVSAWTAARPAAEAAATLQAAGVAAAKSQSSVDLIADEHLWARGFYREPADGSKTVLAPPWQLSCPAEIRAGAPALGQHNDYVFGEVLGLSAEERRRLADGGAIR